MKIQKTQKNKRKFTPKHKILLIIRDGWGYSAADSIKDAKKTGNAVVLAKTPNTDFYEKNYPTTYLSAHGNAVGLPAGVQGGSEVGHYTIGAGRIIWQEYERINRAIAIGEGKLNANKTDNSKNNESFFNNKTLLKAIEHVKKNSSNLHLMGLFSDEGVHATTEHLYALIRLAKQKKVSKVYVHVFLDGRDVPERSADKYFKEFDKRVKAIGANKRDGKFNVNIASIIGRYYAMDRDTNWNRTKLAYDLLVHGKGFMEEGTLKGILVAMKKAYRYSSPGEETDYYVKPMKIKGTPNISDKDAVIFWNFRTDRARQITYAFLNVDPDNSDNPDNKSTDKKDSACKNNSEKKAFNKFPIVKFKNLFYVGMTKYDRKLGMNCAFPEKYLEDNLGHIITEHGLRQLRIAETEKYAHVTFFFNSQIEKPNKGEDRILVPSPKCPSYAEKPEMSAYEVTGKLLSHLKSGKYDFIALNFANGDLVGHSGNLKATIKCCEVVDYCVGKLVNAALKKDYIVMLTADHGNCEEMLYANGEQKPAHSTNPVPFTLIFNKYKCKDNNVDKLNVDLDLKNIRLKKSTSNNRLGLANIAPTILKLLGVQKEKEMEESLI
ncbi:MAG: 2,3-bisphosphoglycerate-independent phosphoglycerate mutase [Candidatus Woesearchaeota archaeon]